MKTNSLATLVLSASLILTGCSSSTPVPVETGEVTEPTIEAPVVNQAARDGNCDLMERFTISDPYNDNWNSYDYWREWEIRLWQKLDSADPESYDAFMELRRINYADNLSSPPEVGEVWTESNYPDSAYLDDFEDDTTKESAISEAAILCPTFDSYFWEEAFALNL